MDRILTLHFVDGTRLSFDFPEQTASAAARQMKLADFLAGRHLVVEADGQVMIFPVANIKYVALSLPEPGPKGARQSLPRHAITGARIRT